MKKLLSISLIAILAALTANAQFSTYSSYDNEESVVYEVEDMSPDEIKTYNKWINSGLSKEDALTFINAGRAHDNLLSAPATIIDCNFIDSETFKSTGEVAISITLLNTTPKTIKEITIEFEFENNSSPVYDIKSGDKFLILKFTNLKGRTNSNLYSDIMSSLTDCLHILKMSDASFVKPFFNKKATTANIHSAKIKYNDGSSTTNIALFNRGYGKKENIIADGPLSPFFRFCEFKNQTDKMNEANEIQPIATYKDMDEDRVNDCDVIGPLGKSNTKRNEPQKVSPPYNHNNEVFSSAAHMPRYPGGDAALMKYLNDHMIYPVQAKNDGIQGKVIVQFVVRKDGSVGETKVSRGVNKELDREAIRLVKSLPVFSPGRNAIGDPVDVWYTLPVTFKLPGLY